MSDNRGLGPAGPRRLSRTYTSLLFLCVVTVIVLWSVWKGNFALMVQNPSESSSTTGTPPQKKSSIFAGITLSRSNSCELVHGRGCPLFHAQSPIPAAPPPRGSKECILDCNYVGNCLATRGVCQCPAGWTGDGCHIERKRYCTQYSPIEWTGEYVKPAPVILSDYREGGLVSTDYAAMCAGDCDEDIGMCYCPASSAYGRKPAPQHSLPGTLPAQKGRPLPHACQPNTDQDGVSVRFKGKVPFADVLGPDGWCLADQPKFQCACILDGTAGINCTETHEHTCPNQCNGHGLCKTGFCKCDAGWFGHDCAYRMEGVNDTPGYEETSRPWIKGQVHTPAAKDPAPGSTRLRPLIWVYELPADYNSLLLQYRIERHLCVSRLYDGGNNSYSTDSDAYQLEMGLHELMLQSPHRTLDAEEADFFYVPVYTSCFIYPISTWGPGPFYNRPGLDRTPQATLLLQHAFHHISSEYPYWDRKGGRDHIFFVSHDEASCWVPKEIRPAIILSHWGRTDANHTSWTGYGPDNYSIDFRDPIYLPDGFLARLGTEPCFNAEKDLVIPSMHGPNFYKTSPLLGMPTKPRTRLALFKGRMQFGNARYSRGVRQRLATRAWQDDWLGKHNIMIGDHQNFSGGPSYGELMASSVFCLVVIGDGWTSRYGDAVSHGCIPVCIMDNVVTMFGTIIEEHDIAVRVKFEDVEKIPKILKAVSKQEIRRTQTNIGKIWKRFIWSSYRPFLDEMKANQAKNLNLSESGEGSLPRREGNWDLEHGDAFETLMEWLFGRIEGPQSIGNSRR